MQIRRISASYRTARWSIPLRNTPARVVQPRSEKPRSNLFVRKLVPPIWELYHTVSGEDEELTEAECEEFSDLLNKCPLVDPREAANPYTRRMRRGTRDGYSSGPLRERFMITQNNTR